MVSALHKTGGGRRLRFGAEVGFGVLCLVSLAGNSWFALRDAARWPLAGDSGLMH